MKPNDDSAIRLNVKFIKKIKESNDFKYIFKVRKQTRRNQHMKSALLHHL